jgi:hypothetical protein
MAWCGLVAVVVGSQFGAPGIAAMPMFEFRYFDAVTGSKYRYYAAPVVRAGVLLMARSCS